MKSYTITEPEIQKLLDKTIDSIFLALSEKGVTIDTEGKITIRVTLTIGDDTLFYNVHLLDRVTVTTEPYHPFADEIHTNMGFKTK